MKNVSNVQCTKCEAVAGIIREVTVDNMVGFFRNVCEPNPMPTKCPLCSGALARVQT